MTLHGHSKVELLPANIRPHAFGSVPPVTSILMKRQPGSLVPRTLVIEMFPLFLIVIPHLDTPLFRIRSRRGTLTLIYYERGLISAIRLVAVLGVLAIGPVAYVVRVTTDNTASTSPTPRDPTPGADLKLSLGLSPNSNTTTLWSPESSGDGYSATRKGMGEDDGVACRGNYSKSLLSVVGSKSWATAVDAN